MKALIFGILIGISINSSFIIFVNYLFKFLNNNKKKKIKNKRVRLKVVFIQNYNGQPILLTQIFSGIYIEHCIAYAKEYAKQYNCRIKSLTRLTAED